MKPLPAKPSISLECPTSSGGKFWKAWVSDTSLHLCWGRRGTAGSKKTLAALHCKNNQPILELKERCLAKLAKGYDIVPHETRLP